MLKGCQRKVIVIKNPGSELFEEAYFIVKPLDKAKKESDFLAEANRIISSRTASCRSSAQNTGTGGTKAEEKKSGPKAGAVSFLFGKGASWLFGFFAGAGTLAGILAVCGVFAV